MTTAPETAAAETTGPFADGVYFALDEETYHADPALGSTDIKKLAIDPANYWFGSALDPDKEPAEEKEEKAHLTLGSAAHKYILEGPDAFHALYQRAATGDDLLRTSDDLAAWLKDRDLKQSGTKAVRIQAILAHCAENEIDAPRILDLIETEAALSGRTILKVADFDRICKAASYVRNNPHLSDSFGGGMPEVSLFWTESVDGVPMRRKCRFDYLKPRATVDLKSSTPADGMEFPESCLSSMARYQYPTQASTYLDGRQLLPLLVQEGRVFGDYDPAWLKRVADARSFAFVFVFWASSGAPHTWGTVLSPGNPVLDVGAEWVRLAMTNYAAAYREFGPRNPWLRHRPLEELDISRMPRWWRGPAVMPA